MNDEPKHNGNGSGGNGHDKDANKDADNNIQHFPTLAERDRIRKTKEKQEQQYRAHYKKQRQGTKPPFINIDRIPPFTRYMAVLLVVIHIIVHLVISPGARLQLFYILGFVPGYFTGMAPDFPWFAPFEFLTYIFLHTDWTHLMFNSVMMVALGVFFERGFGTRTMVMFFFICGIVGALVYLAFNPFTTVPLIGASGSISGLFAAMIMMMQSQGQLGALGKRGPWPVILFWTFFLLVVGMIGGVNGENLAWQAHIGGFLTGAGLFHLMMTGRIKL